MTPTSGTTAGLALGDTAPSYELRDTAGQTWSLVGAEEAPATVVVFTCNHCPYALAWHDRIGDAAREYASRGVRFLAINPNDGDRYPRDSYEAMQRRVAAEDWPMPYLHDAQQEVARAFGAKTTPRSVRARRRRGAALSRRARRRPRRSESARSVAARRTRRGARRSGSRPSLDAAGWVLDQVEAVAR